MKQVQIMTPTANAIQAPHSSAKKWRGARRILMTASKKAGSNLLLTKRPTYVDHPAFADPDIEAFLFGADGERLAKTLVPFRWPLANGQCTAGQQAPVFSLADEQRLFMRFNYARRAVALVLDAAVDCALSVENRRLLRNWEQRANEAQVLLVQANLRLVIAMLRKFNIQKGDWNEFISDGNVALLRCVDLFDCSRGYKFSTYCCNAIFKSFKQVVIRTSRYRALFPTTFSANMMRGCDYETPNLAVESEYLDALREILHCNQAGLSEVESYVIQMRFGFLSHGDPDMPKTLKAIGRLLGVSKERVRQIQTKALKKIRETLILRRLAA